MSGKQSCKFDLDENGAALLLGELDHRIRNLLMMIEATLRQTHSTSVEDYRAKVMARIASLHQAYEFASPCGRVLELAELLEQTIHPYCANGARVLAAGPDIELAPCLALALHLVFHELAANAQKYGSLSSPVGRVEINWKIRPVPGAPRKLAIVWTEHGGPHVHRPRHRGFGSRLIKRALDGYGGVRLDFSRAGLACFMLIDLDRADAQTEEPGSEPRSYRGEPHSHSSQY